MYNDASPRAAVEDSPSEVSQQISFFTEAALDLLQTVNYLETRLATVLRGETVSDTESFSDKKDSHLVPVAETIRVHTRSIYLSISRINDIINRLGI